MTLTRRLSLSLRFRPARPEGREERVLSAGRERRRIDERRVRVNVDAGKGGVVDHRFECRQREGVRHEIAGDEVDGPAHGRDAHELAGAEDRVVEVARRGPLAGGRSRSPLPSSQPSPSTVDRSHPTIVPWIDQSYISPTSVTFCASHIMTSRAHPRVTADGVASNVCPEAHRAIVNGHSLFCLIILGTRTQQIFARVALLLRRSARFLLQSWLPFGRARFCPARQFRGWAFFRHLTGQSWEPRCKESLLFFLQLEFRRKEEGSLLGTILARFRPVGEPPKQYDSLYPTFRGSLQPSSRLDGHGRRIDYPSVSGLFARFDCGPWSSAHFECRKGTEQLAHLLPDFRQFAPKAGRPRSSPGS